MWNMALNLPPLTSSARGESEIQERDFLYSDTDIKNMLKTGTQIFGVPGASLTWGIEGSGGGQVTAGGEGEKQVAKELELFASKNPGVKIFHSVQWPGSKGDTDHMLVAGNLVFIIDAKRWKSKRKYSVTPKGAILRGTVPFPEGKVKMIPAMSAWRKTLGSGVKVTGVVCIAQTEVFVPYDKNWYSAPYRLVVVESLSEFLEKALAKQKPELVKAKNPQLLIDIARKVIKPRDRRAEIINISAMKR